MSKQIAKNEIIQHVAENETLIALGAKHHFEAILNISAGFKGMKDLGEKVGWKILGYKNFEDYTVARWNLARIQADKYVRVAEKLPENFCQRLTKSSKASIERLFLLLPNDQTELKLTPEEVEELMLLPPGEFKEQIADIAGYNRKVQGGRGPSDLDRPKISRDRYRDQQKKIQQLESKVNTMECEKDDLVDEIEKLEKQTCDLKKTSSPDREKNELIQENKGLLLKIAELEKLVNADKTLTLLGEMGMQRAAVAVSECSAIFGKLAKIELTSHDQWVEFRAYTDTIRHLLETCEERVAVTMAEKGLHPKEYEEWHDGSFKYHMDKATEKMRKDYAEKLEDEARDATRQAKEERKKRKKK